MGLKEQGIPLHRGRPLHRPQWRARVDRFPLPGQLRRERAWCLVCENFDLCFFRVWGLLALSIELLQVVRLHTILEYGWTFESQAMVRW